MPSLVYEIRLTLFVKNMSASKETKVDGLFHLPHDVYPEVVLLHKLSADIVSAEQCIPNAINLLVIFNLIANHRKHLRHAE